MTIEDLQRHLDKRLDKQDLERASMSRDIVNMKVAMGRSQVAAENARDACRAGHASHGKRIARMEGGFVAVGVAAVAFVWSWVTGKGGA